MCWCPDDAADRRRCPINPAAAAFEIAIGEQFLTGQGRGAGLCLYRRCRQDRGQRLSPLCVPTLLYKKTEHGQQERQDAPIVLLRCRLFSYATWGNGRERPSHAVTLSLIYKVRLHALRGWTMRVSCRKGVAQILSFSNWVNKLNAASGRKVSAALWLRRLRHCKVTAYYPAPVKLVWRDRLGLEQRGWARR